MLRDEPDDEGALFCWGQNEHGALCLPSLEDEAEPCRVLQLRSQFVRAVGAGRGFSTAATASNSLLWWGSAGDGLPRPTEGGPETCCAMACTATTAFALSDSGEVHMWTPRAPMWERLWLAVDVELLACGEAHSLALSRDGEVFAWGRGAEGQLGRGVLEESVERPQVVEALHGQVASLSCGAAHTAFVSRSGALLGCGRGALLGGGAPARQPTPTPIAGPWQGGDAPLVGVACGRAHTLVLAGNGQLFSLGEGASGQLGHGGAAMGRPNRVGGPLASRAVSATWGSHGDQSFAQTEDGRLWMWGAPPGGGAPAASLPVEVAALRDCPVKQVACSGAHVLALSTGGDLHAWGGGASGALGLQLLGAQPHPRRQPSLDKLHIVSLSCGDGPHVLALESAQAANRVFSWGRNGNGELGLPRDECSACAAPRIVASGALAGRRDEPLLGVSAGGQFSLAWGRGAASAVGWGACGRMQLGAVVATTSPDDGDDGTGGVQYAPRRLSSPDGQPLLGGAGGTIVCLSAGWQHAGASVALGGSGSEGVPLLWGCGEGGALGSGETLDRAVAAEARGSLAGCRVRLLGSGRDSGAAVDASGQLHCWGGGARGASPLPRVLSLSATRGPSAPAHVLQLCCVGRRLLVVADVLDIGEAGLAVYELSGGGAARPLRQLEGEPVSMVAGSSDSTLALTRDGRVLRLGVSPASDAQLEELPLPDGGAPRLISAARTHGALVAAWTSAERAAAARALGDVSAAMSASAPVLMSASAPLPQSHKKSSTDRPCWLQS